MMDLKAMSSEALVAVMNALNPSPGGFLCEGDRQAFIEVSRVVGRRWWVASMSKRN